MKTTCKNSWPVNLCGTSSVFSVCLTTEVVPKIFPNLNVVGHLAVPAGWGSFQPRLAIFFYYTLVQLHTAYLFLYFVSSNFSILWFLMCLLNVCFQMILQSFPVVCK